MSPLDDRRLAIARGRSYDLLGDLFEHGPRRLEHLGAVDALRPHVPEACDDEALAEHHRVLSVEVLPYASAFIEADRCLGGEVSQRLGDRLAIEGDPDALWTQLRWLALLCGAEADALQDRVEVVGAQAFLGEELLPWLGALHHALPEGLYKAGAALLIELAEGHHSGRVEDRLQPAEDLVANPKTGLGQIADYLATPARCGAWLAPWRLRRVSDLPRGFGSRARLLENLLQGAARHGQVPQVLAALQAELSGLPEGPWAERVAHTRAQLEVVRLSPPARPEGAPPPG